MIDRQFGFVYVLICPITAKIRYVGSTKNPSERTWAHNCVSGYNYKLDEWKETLFKVGKKPIINFIATCKMSELLDTEADYYQKYKHLDLLNLNILQRRLTKDEILDTIKVAKDKKIKQIDVVKGTGIHQVIVSEFFRLCENHMNGTKQRQIRDFVLHYGFTENYKAPKK